MIYADHECIRQRAEPRDRAPARALCERLRRGLLDARSQRMLHRLREAFSSALAAHDEWLSTQLFPALYESMAGSDAVCIRAMESGMRADHRSLAAQWHALAPLLGSDALPSTHAQMLLPRIEALTALCVRLADFERDELFPMAERLLSDDVLAGLRA